MDNLIPESKQCYLSCILTLRIQKRPLNPDSGSDTCLRLFGWILLQSTNASSPLEFSKIAATAPPSSSRLQGRPPPYLPLTTTRRYRLFLPLVVDPHATLSMSPCLVSYLFHISISRRFSVIIRVLVWRYSDSCLPWSLLVNKVNPRGNSVSHQSLSP